MNTENKNELQVEENEVRLGFPFNPPEDKGEFRFKNLVIAILSGLVLILILFLGMAGGAIEELEEKLFLKQEISDTIDFSNMSISVMSKIVSDTLQSYRNLDNAAGRKEYKCRSIRNNIKEFYNKDHYRKLHGSNYKTFVFQQVMEHMQMEGCFDKLCSER